MRRLSRAAAATTLLAGLAAGTALLAAPGAAWAARAGTARAGQPEAVTTAHSVIIVMDVSSALGPGGLAAERDAALSYLRALPAGVLTGVQSFSGQPVTAWPPTTDTRVVTAALTGTRLVTGNAAGLPAALASAARTLAGLVRSGAVSTGRVVVFTAGTGLRGPLARPGLPTDVVAPPGDAASLLVPLRQLAEDSGGELTTDSQAASLAAAVGGSGRQPGTPQRGPVPSTPARPAARPAGAPSTSLDIVAVIVFVCLAGVVFAVLGGLSRDDTSGKLAAQIERYGPRHTSGDGESAAARVALGWATRILAGEREQRLAEQLDLAGVKTKPAEFLVVGGCATVGLAGVLALLTGSALGVILGLVAGAAGLRFGLNFKIKRRRAKFAKQLPDVLQLVAGSLQSGFSLPQALNSLTKEDMQPSAAEFERALAQTRFGVELEPALSEIADRMESTDLRWAVMAIRIQRQVGGNLAAVLATTVNTMRDRAALRGQVRALSAEGRLSGYVLIAMPILIGAWLFMSDRAYLSPLFDSVPGIIMSVGAVIMLVCGIIWMQKLVNIEV